ncbi:MAG: tRNA (adenosine(37)-N6)-threonylcarbamoyltransferase complex ATPase subunit type 1 TsaE [candidate division Zixibacteria bacterium]
MPRVLNIVSHSETETFALGEKMAAMFPDGSLVVLSGELGAGKTVFVKGLAKGMGLEKDSATSPTFNMVHEYRGERELYHFDLYRLRDTSELVEIGWDDYLERQGVAVVEWGEKAGALLPQKYYLVEINSLNDDENEREINVSLIEK